MRRDELSRGGRPTLSGSPGDRPTPQLGLFAQLPENALDFPLVKADDEVRQRLRAVDIDDTTPRQALELLAELKKLADNER